MSPKSTPWEEISSRDRGYYQKLASTFTPKIRLKPFDLWVNLRIRFRAAILKTPYRGRHISRIQLALHYLWDAPSKDDLKTLRPKWVKATINRWHEDFAKHVEQWGPGDAELVTIILQRQPTLPNLDLLDPSEFVVHEIDYRTGANVRGVLRQAKEGRWNKLGNIRVHYDVNNAPFEMDARRPVLTIDSYHHSFFEPGKTSADTLRWPEVVLPAVEYFVPKEWKRFKIKDKKRGAEAWELLD